MAKKKGGGSTLFIPKPGAVELAVLEVSGANSLDGAVLVRLSIGGVHFGFSPEDADKLAVGLQEYAELVRRAEDGKT